MWRLMWKCESFLPRGLSCSKLNALIPSSMTIRRKNQSRQMYARAMPSKIVTISTKRDYPQCSSNHWSHWIRLWPKSPSHWSKKNLIRWTSSAPTLAQPLLLIRRWAPRLRLDPIVRQSVGGFLNPNSTWAKTNPSSSNQAKFSLMWRLMRRSWASSGRDWTVTSESSPNQTTCMWMCPRLRSRTCRLRLGLHSLRLKKTLIWVRPTRPTVY